MVRGTKLYFETQRFYFKNYCKKLKVSDDVGKEYQINKIFLSPVGIHMKGLYFNPIFGEQNGAEHFKMKIKKVDGQIIPLASIVININNIAVPVALINNERM